MALPSKFVEPRPFSNPEAAARKLLEIAAGIIDVRGRVSVGAWNDAFRKAGGNVAEYAAGRDRAIADGALRMHECGGFVMLT
ncbi:hypothetical protein [Tardiphaga sp.]|uniref:hypothetical protein n=1 Tax=Tardiphaga sp. TaxID=1926292 RepID=UPI0026059AA4|nr:hypothetical protein [Tardiphaga sp.]MDB5618385.1 hypothetical protein [Tardiphaga sp.]